MLTQQRHDKMQSTAANRALVKHCNKAIATARHRCGNSTATSGNGIAATTWLQRNHDNNLLAWCRSSTNLNRSSWPQTAVCSASSCFMRRPHASAAWGTTSSGVQIESQHLMPCVRARTLLCHRAPWNPRAIPQGPQTPPMGAGGPIVPIRDPRARTLRRSGRQASQAGTQMLTSTRLLAFRCASNRKYTHQDTGAKMLAEACASHTLRRFDDGSSWGWESAFRRLATERAIATCGTGLNTLSEVRMNWISQPSIEI